MKVKFIGHPVKLQWIFSRLNNFSSGHHSFTDSWWSQSIPSLWPDTTNTGGECVSCSLVPRSGGWTTVQLWCAARRLEPGVTLEWQQSVWRQSLLPTWISPGRAASGEDPGVRSWSLQMQGRLQGELTVSEQASLQSQRTNIIFKVCSHGTSLQSKFSWIREQVNPLDMLKVCKAWVEFWKGFSVVNNNTQLPLESHNYWLKLNTFLWFST